MRVVFLNSTSFTKKWMIEKNKSTIITLYNKGIIELLLSKIYKVNFCLFAFPVEINNEIWFISAVIWVTRVWYFE